MKAYQYFHIPSGYEAKISDNDKITLGFVEKIRSSIQSNVYFACVHNADFMTLLSSKLDENKNQLIRGRIFTPNEIRNLTISYIENIPDIRILRSDSPLLCRPFEPRPFIAKPYTFNMNNFALVFDALINNKDINVFFKDENEALTTLRLLLFLLPLEYHKSISYVITNQLVPHQIDALNPFGEKISARIQLCFIIRTAKDFELSEDYIDFTKNNDVSSLSPVAKIVCDTDLSYPAGITQLKNNLNQFITDKGFNVALIGLGKKVDEFILHPDTTLLKEIIDLLAETKEEAMNIYLDQLSSFFLKQLENDTYDASFAPLLEELNKYERFYNAVSIALANYKKAHFLSFDDNELLSFASELSSSDAAMREFIDGTMNETNARKKSKRVKALHAAMFLTAPQIDVSQYMEVLFDMVDIRNCYQLLSYEEKNSGEDLFYSVPLEGPLTDGDVAFLAFLVYSAYVKGVDKTWKKMRLLGLEKRLNHLEILDRLEVLIQIRSMIESYGYAFYMNPKYAILDLNDFYFDIYQDSIKVALSRADYRKMMMFYDKHLDVPYLSLKTAISEALCDINLFLKNYPEINHEQTKKLLNIFKSMKASEKQVEIVAFLEDSLKEYDLNIAFLQFRSNFLLKTYNLLSPEDKESIPSLPSFDSPTSQIVHFSEQLTSYLTKYEGFTNLHKNLEVETAEAKVASNASGTSNVRKSPSKVIKTKLYVNLDYTPLTHKRFDVKVTIEADESVKVPELLLVTSRFYPTDDNPGVMFYDFPGGEIKKKLFGKPKISFVAKCDPLEYAQTIYVILADKDAPFIIQTTKS